VVRIKVSLWRIKTSRIEMIRNSVTNCLVSDILLCCTAVVFQRYWSLRCLK